MAHPLAVFFGGTGTMPTSPPPPPPPPPGAPNAPTSLSQTSVTPTTWVGGWTDNASDETGHNLYASGSLKGTAAANATSGTWSSLTEGTQYDFTVNAENASGESPDSNTVTAYTQLAAPTGFSASLSGGVVTFTWVNASSNYTELQMQKDAADEGSALPFGTTQYQEPEGTAAGTWRVYAKASGIPDSDKSGSVTGPSWPE